MLAGQLKTSPLRVALLALAALLIGGAAFAPGLVIRWYDGPGRAKRPPPESTWAKIDTSREQLAFTWPARGEERPAPELSLRVLPTDWYAWWSERHTPAERRIPPDGPVQLLMEVSVPNGDAILPEDMAPLCAPGDAALEGCAGARARITVHRDDADWDRTDVLLGRRPPHQNTRVTQDGHTVPVIHEFWIRLDEDTGRDRFLGWQCTEGNKDLPLPPLAQARPQSLYTCFEPGPWWERKWPGRFGYQRQRVYTSCSAGDGCEMLFLFSGRLVRLEFVDLLPARDRELARFRLLLSAWEMLNRQRKDATYPPQPTAELAEARAQLAMCESAAATFTPLTLEQRRAMTSSQRQRAHFLSISCERAANIAIRLKTAATGEAERLLGRAIAGLAALEISRGNAQALFDAWFEALDAIGRGESKEALEASILYLRSGPRYAINDPKREHRAERVRATRALLTRFGSSLSEEARTEAYARMAAEYYGDERRTDLAELRKEYANLVGRQHGEASREMLEPLRDLVQAQWLAGDSQGLAESVERLRTAWLRQAAEPDAIADHDRRLLIASTGFNVVFGLRVIAFREVNHAVVAPRIEEVIQVMRSLLGDADPFVRAAQFHQREVVTGRAVEGAMIGGGLLPYRY